MRSGFCSDGDKRHDRCRLDSCSCPQHDADLKAKAAALVAPEVAELLEPGESPRPLWDAVAEVAFAALHVTKEATGLSDLPPEEALRVLYGLRDAIDNLRDVDAALVQHLYLHGEHGDVRVEGLPAARVQRNRDRKAWDERGAVRDYVNHQIVSNDGELPDPLQVVEWVLNVVGVNYCRVTPLKAAGLDPKDYCTETPGSLSVAFFD